MVIDMHSKNEDSSFKEAMLDIGRVQNMKAMLKVLTSMLSHMGEGETGVRLQEVHDAQKEKEAAALRSEK
jgi:hypothetical protein